MRTVWMAVPALVTATTALAADRSYSSESLVMLLSSEKACDLAYEKEAIEAYVKHFADQQQSIPNLGSEVALQRDYVIKVMTPSTLIAHCAQVRSAAKLYGFIK